MPRDTDTGHGRTTGRQWVKLRWSPTMCALIYTCLNGLQAL